MNPVVLVILISALLQGVALGGGEFSRKSLFANNFKSKSASPSQGWFKGLFSRSRSSKASPSTPEEHLANLKDIQAKLNSNTKNLQTDGIFRVEGHIGKDTKTIAQLPRSLRKDPVVLAQLFKRNLRSIITPLTEQQMEAFKKSPESFLNNELPKSQREAIAIAIEQAKLIDSHSSQNRMKAGNMAKMISNGFIPDSNPHLSMMENQRHFLENSMALENTFKKLIDNPKLLKKSSSSSSELPPRSSSLSDSPLRSSMDSSPMPRVLADRPLTRSPSPTLLPPRSSSLSDSTGRSSQDSSPMSRVLLDKPLSKSPSPSLIPPRTSSLSDSPLRSSQGSSSPGPKRPRTSELFPQDSSAAILFQ